MRVREHLTFRIEPWQIVERSTSTSIVTLKIQEIGAQHARLPTGRLIAKRLDQLKR